MYSPLQSMNIKGSAGDPLPEVYHALTAKGTQFLRGQLTLDLCRSWVWQVSVYAKPGYAVWCSYNVLLCRL